MTAIIFCFDFDLSTLEYLISCQCHWIGWAIKFINLMAKLQAVVTNTRFKFRCTLLIRIVFICLFTTFRKRPSNFFMIVTTWRMELHFTQRKSIAMYFDFLAILYFDRHDAPQHLAVGLVVVYYKKILSDYYLHSFVSSGIMIFWKGYTITTTHKN